MSPAHVKRVRHIKIPDKITGPRQVAVGFPAGKVATEIVDRAIWNHYGTSRGIPPRPFLLNTMRKHKNEYQKILKTEGARILKGEYTLDTLMSQLGAKVSDDVKMGIDELKTPPNAPSTIRQKGSDNPLIDTGEMRQKVTWEKR